MHSDSILTILIPTRNRAFCLQNLLNSFVAKDLGDDIEILLAINASDDGSLPVAELYQQKIPNLKIKYFDEFLHSAEENINRSITYCRGKYVFILGDDDVLIFETFGVMLSILRSDQKNLPALIFNNITSSNKVINFRDQVKEKSRISFEGISDEVTFRSGYSKLLKDLGVITIMAFISRYVIRKDLFGDFSGHIKTSRIYSHVFAFLEFLHKEDVVVVDLPLTRRGYSVVDERFKAMSDSLGQSTFFSWHHGLLLHVSLAVKNKFISPSWFFEVREFRDDGSTFSLWTNTIEAVCFQIIKYLKDLKEHEKMSRESIEILRSFESSSLSPFDCKAFSYILSEIEEILSEINNKKLSKRGRKFCSWEARRLYEMLAVRHSLKPKNSLTFRLKKLIYTKMLQILKINFFPEVWFFFMRKRVKKIEMKSWAI